MEYAYKINQLYIQNNFLKYTEDLIRYQYKINPSHKILCGIWIGKFFRKGFVITDKSLHWNFGHEKKLISDCLEKEDNEFLFSVENVIAENIANTSESFVSKLSIKTENQIKNIYFNNLNDGTKQAVLDLLHFGVNQGEIPKIDLRPAVIQKKSSKIRNFFDYLSNSIIMVKESIFTAFSKLKIKQKEPKIKSEKKFFSISIFFSHFFDFVSSLFFISAVIVALKPELLADLHFDRIPIKITEFIGNCSLQLKLRVPPREELIPIRNLWVSILLSSFLLLKSFVMCLCHSSKKLVTFLMPILTILSCSLVSEKFLFFVLFCIILYFCFELLCDFPLKTITRKFIVLTVLSFVLYFLAHVILMNSQMLGIFTEIGIELKKLFRELSLPIFLL